MLLKEQKQFSTLLPKDWSNDLAREILHLSCLLPNRPINVTSLKTNVPKPSIDKVNFTSSLNMIIFHIIPFCHMEPPLTHTT